MTGVVVVAVAGVLLVGVVVGVWRARMRRSTRAAEIAWLTYLYEAPCHGWEQLDS